MDIKKKFFLYFLSFAAISIVLLVVFTYFFVYESQKESLISHKYDQIKGLSRLLHNSVMLNDLRKIQSETRRILGEKSSYLCVMLRTINGEHKTIGNNDCIDYRASVSKLEHISEGYRIVDGNLVVKSSISFGAEHSDNPYVIGFTNFNQIRVVAMKSLISYLAVFLLMIFAIYLLMIVFWRKIYEITISYLKVISGTFTQKEPDRKTDIDDPFHIIGEINRLKSDLINYREKMIEQSRMAGIGQIAQELAHDLKAPVGSIQGMIREIESGSINENNKSKAYSLVLNNLDRINNLVVDLQDYTRVEKLNSKKVERDEFAEIVKTVIERVKSDIIDINVSFKLENRDYNFDSEKIVRVLDNILKNAIDAINDNGKISVRINNHHSKADKIEIEVSDNGKGIEERYYQKIFEPYFTRDKRLGHGMGLSICRKFIQLHGGEIFVKESSPGKGTIISFWF